jgi:hypothetical protein
MDLTIYFSLKFILIKLALAIFSQISGTLCKHCIVSLTPFCSTYRKGKSCLILEATNHSINLLGQNLQTLTDTHP